MVVTRKTIRRALARLKAGDQRTQRKELQRNYDVAAGVVAARVARTSGRISAKRLLPEARVTAAAPSTRTCRRIGPADDDDLGDPKDQPEPGGEAVAIGQLGLDVELDGVARNLRKARLIIEAPSHRDAALRGRTIVPYGIARAGNGAGL